MNYFYVIKKQEKQTTYHQKYKPITITNIRLDFKYSWTSIIRYGRDQKHPG